MRQFVGEFDLTTKKLRLLIPSNQFLNKLPQEDEERIRKQYGGYMTELAPNPEGRLDFLLKNVSLLLCREFEQRIQQEGLGLTRFQSIILCQLSLLEGCLQRELAESLKSDAVTISRQIKRLVAAGWLERRDDPGDGRTHQLYIRSQARNVLVQLRRLIAQLCEECFTGIPLERREVLIDDLLIIRKNLLACRARTEGRLAAPRMPTSRS